MLKDKAQNLAEARELVNRLKTQLDEAKVLKDNIQQALIEEMSEQGFKSIKTDTHNFAVVNKKDVRIVDEQALKQHLGRTGMLDSLMVHKVDTVAFKSTANAMLKETGEMFDGTEVVETEYMSIKAQKKPTEQELMDEAEAKADSDRDSHIKDHIL